jgi:hypothetical protein
MNCTLVADCARPHVRLCTEGLCVAPSADHVAAVVLAVLGFLHTVMWCRWECTGRGHLHVVEVPGTGVVVVYVVVHVLGGLASLLITIIGFGMSSFRDGRAYHRRVGGFLGMMTARWVLALFLEWTCWARARVAPAQVRVGV